MNQLVRGLGPAAAASINITNMIGTGVFLKARIMTCNVDTPWAVLGVWVAAGLLVLAGALTYAELMAMMPRAGGEYVILRETYGKRVGFLYGWTYLASSRSASLAAQAVSAGIFLNIVTGGLLEGKIVMVAVGMLAIMVALNCLAVKTTGTIATALTTIKIVLVASIGVIAFLFAKGDWANYALTNTDGACAGVAESARGGLAGFGAAMLGALWGFQGWANFAPMAGEVKNPQRNIPIAFVGALALVGSLYLFANASYFYVLTPTEIANVSLSSSVATETLQRVFGAVAVSLMAAGMLVSSMGSLHAGIAATMRVPYAMASDGLYFRGLEKISEKTKVPVRAAVFVGALASALALVGNYDRLTDYAIFLLWLFYGLTAASVIVLRRRMPDTPRPFRVPFYPVLPVVFLLVTALILVNTLLTQPVQAGIGLGIMALGLPFYAWWTRPRA